MCDILIDKNVDIPTRNKRRGKKIYPFGTMDVGDSFFVECTKDDLSRTQCLILASCRPGRFDGKMFTTRRVEGGIRCWRLE